MDNTERLIERLEAENQELRERLRATEQELDQHKRALQKLMPWDSNETSRSYPYL